MKIYKKLVACAAALTIISTNVFAENVMNMYQATIKDGNVSFHEENLYGEVDNSNLNVIVIKQLGNINKVIYVGNLGGYDNGAWSNIDFSEIQVMAIMNGSNSNDGVIYIIPRDFLETANKSIKHTTPNLTSDSSNITISSNVKLNGVNVGENGLRIVDNANLECRFTLSNNSDDEQSVSVMLTTYTDEGKLYQVKMTTIDIAARSSNTGDIFYQFDAEHERMGKLMFWNSVTGMFPFRASIDFSGTSGVNAYYYDTNNRLIQIDKADKTSIYFNYDNMGNLLRKTVERTE